MSDFKSDTEPSRAVVLDWDGTVTVVDSLHMLIERFGDHDVFVALEGEVGRRLTLEEVIAREMATVTAPLGEMAPLAPAEAVIVGSPGAKLTSTVWFAWTFVNV